MATKDEIKPEIEHAGETASIKEDLKARDEPLIQRQHVDQMTVAQAAWAYRKVGLFCLLAAFSASLDGYQGSLNGSITSNKGFINQFGNANEKGAAILDGTWVSIWGGMTSLFQTIAPFCMPFVNDRFGRRIGLWVAWVLLVAAALGESFVTNSAGWMGAKFFAGAGIGAVQSTLPLYINELSPTQIRGLFTEAYTFWYVCGQLMAAVSLQQLNKNQPLDYRTAIYTQFAMLGVLGFIYFFLPETPWYLITSGQDEKARGLLLKLKSTVPGYDVDTELAVLKNTVDEQRARANVVGRMPLRMIFQGLNLKRLVIACWPKLTQQAVGLSVFNNYSTYFFQAAGFADPFLISVILTCCQLISMIGTMLAVDTIGRRPLAVYGYLITVVADFGMAGTGFSDVSTNSQLAGTLVFFACLATFTTTSSSAIGYAYMSEIPKQDFRAKSAGWCLGFSNIFSVMFSFVTPILIKGNLSTGGSFAGWGVKTAFFFGCLGGIIATIGWFIVPETARRTPAEIDEMFEKRVALRKFKGYVTDIQKEQQAQEDGYTS